MEYLLVVVCVTLARLSEHQLKFGGNDDGGCETCRSKAVTIRQASSTCNEAGWLKAIISSRVHPLVNSSSLSMPARAAVQSATSGRRFMARHIPIRDLTEHKQLHSQQSGHALTLTVRVSGRRRSAWCEIDPETHVQRVSGFGDPADTSQIDSECTERRKRGRHGVIV